MIGHFGTNGARGPSQLFADSGSTSTLPKQRDYHTNLTTLSKYSETGPGSYNLPSLFSKDDKASTAMKRNPQYSFRTKVSENQYISKEHLRSFLLRESPAATAFSPIIDRTFDQISFRNTRGDNEDAVTTFSTADRFKMRPAALAKIIAEMPLQYVKNDTFGEGLTKALK